MALSNLWPAPNPVHGHLAEDPPQEQRVPQQAHSVLVTILMAVPNADSQWVKTVMKR